MSTKSIGGLQMRNVVVLNLAVLAMACSDGGGAVAHEPTSTARAAPTTATAIATATVTPKPTATATATPTAGEAILDTVSSSPKAMVYADWGWNPALSFDEISVTVDIHNDIEYRGDNGLYLIACTAFSIGENGAYFGLQTDVSTGPTGGWRGIGKGGIFSVWDVANPRSPSEDYLTVLAGQRQWIATTNFAGCPGRPPDSRIAPAHYLGKSS